MALYRTPSNIFVKEIVRTFYDFCVMFSVFWYQSVAIGLDNCLVKKAVI